MPKRTNGTAVLGPIAQRVHLLVPTHTTRHLDTCLASLACQIDPPDSITVTCDVEDAGIPALVDRLWPRVADTLAGRSRSVPTLSLVTRPHAGVARLNQVRNNGLRAIVESGASPSDLVVVIDGDMVLTPRAIERHRTLAAGGADVIIPFRVNTTEAQASRVSPEDFLREPVAWPEALTLSFEEADCLNARDRRYVRQMLVRRFAPMVIKPHKPKLLGGHHAVRLSALLAVNGYDEQYLGYGYDDDDLARRLHAHGGFRWTVAVREIPAFHLWHPTRAPARPADTPGHARFTRSDLPARCERGLDSPIEQSAPHHRRAQPGARATPQPA